MNRQAHLVETQRIQKRYENKYYPIVNREIQRTVNETISTVKSRGVHGAISSLNHQLTNKGLTVTLYNMAEEVGLRFARKQQMDFNKQKKGFGNNETWKKMIKSLLFDFISQQSFSIFETTRDTLIRTLNKSIEQGLGVDETVKMLEGLNLSDYQAARIVRTEITRASNAGVSVASKTYPYEQTKEWIAAHDDRTRHAHMTLDGLTVNVDDVWIDEDGNQLRFPGDPEAAAETTINCRCAMAVVAKVNARGRLIPLQSEAS